MTLRRLLRLVVAIALGELLGLYAAELLAQQHKATLRGQVFESPDAPDDFCTFFLVGAGESESIQSISFSNDSYLCDYLKGSHDMAVTFTPE